jgi:rfaE bifunctional protein nucleotidyltransferase chain/domain
MMSPILTHEQAEHWARIAQASGKKIVMTNGVFDILHLGHVQYLRQAKSLGDLLILALNADSSVRTLNKGPERPINPQEARAEVMASLRCVDAVVIFDQPTPLELILRLKPDVLVKGGDYNPEQTDPAARDYMVGAPETRARGGQAVCIPLTPGFSTTSIVRKMKG